MADLTVRRVHPAETALLEAVGALTAEVYVGDGHTPPSSPYVAELSDASHRAAAAELLAALDEDRLLGAVTLAVAPNPYAEQADEGEAVFRMLAVRATERGRGVGEALVRACIERAAAAGASVLRLSTQPDMSSAHRLYARLGFLRTPERDWEPIPGFVLLTYALPLS